MSTRSFARIIFPPLDNPELTIQRRSHSDPSLLNNFEMVAEGNDDLPAPNLRTMEELCQPSLNGRDGPIASVAIQAMNFGLKNDMIQQVHNSCQFHGLSGDNANKHLDKFLHVTQSIKVNGFPPSMVTKLRNEITNFRQRRDESLFEAWERYKLSIDRCTNHNMLLVTQIDTFYNGLTLRHRDTINAAAGGTFMKRCPKECYDVIENMTAHHNDWDTSTQRSKSSSSITSSSDTEIAELKAKMAKINKNLMRVLQPPLAILKTYMLWEPIKNQNRNQGNHHPQGNKQGKNQFFQGANQGQNQPPAYQAPAYQAPVHQPQIPQPQVVTTNEFIIFMKANDALLKNMQTNMTSLTNSNLELKNMFGQFMKMNTASSSGSGTLPAQEMWEAIERLQQEILNKLRGKDMQKNLALIAKYLKKIYKPTNNNLRTSSNSRNKNVDTTPRYKNDNQSGQFGNQRTVNVTGARENVGTLVVQQSGIQCFNCKEFRHFAKECRKPKRVKDSAYHKEKMLLCKQAEKGVPLQAEQYDWLADTDEEINEQELEAHYSYMAKIQEVPTADTCTDSEPLKKVQNDTGYNVFANDLQHSEQSESISNTCLVETNDSNVIPDSPYMCDDDIQNDQNDVESDDECVALANLTVNLKLDVNENKKVQKQLKKANTTLAQVLKECKTILAETSKTLGESISVRDSCLVALQNKHTEFEKYKAFNDRTVDYDKLEQTADNAWIKHSKDQFRALTAQDLEILIQTCLMPLAIKSQNDRFIFVHELKQEMYADLKYVESLEKEIDELESDKAEFSSMYDMILQESVSNEVMCTYFLSLSDLDALAELQCLYLHIVKECDCVAQKLSKQTKSVKHVKNDTIWNEQASNVFRKECKKYVKIHDLKAQLQDKNIAISELKKLIEKGKGKYVETKFDKPSVVQQPNAQRIPKPSALGKPAPFSDSLERRYFSKTKSVPKTNVSEGLSKPVTAQTLSQTARQAVSNTNVLKPRMYQIDNMTTQTRAPQLPQTVRNTNPCVSTSTRVNHKTNVSRPRHRINQLKDKVVPNNSQVKLKKTQVEEHPRISSISNKIKSVTVCNDSLNSRTSNANAVCATCKKRLVDSDHFACVTKMLNDVNARIKKPNVVPISTRKPKAYANKSFAPILGYGDLVQGNIMINRVYYVEGLNHNLFSVGQFCDANLEVTFKKSTCFVRDLQGNDLLTGNHGSDLYTISLQESTSLTPLCLMAKASPTQAWLWHRILSHLNFNYINLLSKKDVVICLPKLKYVKDQLCSSCELSKAKRSSFKSKAVPSSKGRLNLLHMDLCGPMRVASINGKKYIMVIIDDYSRYSWTLFLRSKDETPKVLKEFLTMIQRNLQALVIIVRTDRGTKFLNKTLNAIFKEEGIEHQTSTARTPAQNGVVKRRNHTLVKAARTMLLASKSKGFRVYNKRTRLIVESIHICFDEIKEMFKTSVANDTSGLVPQRQKASDYDISDPVPQLQNVSSSADIRVPSQQELDLLFGPFYNEFFTSGYLSVNKSSSPINNTNQQDTQPTTNIQPTSAPSTLTYVHVEENNDHQAEEEHLQNDEFTNPFCAPVQEVAESSSHNIGKRYAQEEGIDFEESFAPVARLKAV
nr:retrovirus-related Pol polyprotein from transposon TNT 1-94 [Tanacetum cinerariifolium]